MIDFSNIKSCSENWDKMAKCGDARICQKCSRVIHDFRGKSSLEIGLIHASSEEKVCGVYPSTLNQKPRTLSKWLLSAGVLSLLQLAPQQDVMAKPQTEQIQGTPTYEAQEKAVDSTKKTQPKLQFTGKVLDEQSQPVHGAMIYIKGTTSATATDSSGSFHLDLTTAMQNEDSCEIVVHWLGYGKETVRLSADSIRPVINKDSIIRIMPSRDMITYGVRIPGYDLPRKPSLWQRITAPFRRLFRRF